MKPFYCITAWVNCVAVALVLIVGGCSGKNFQAMPHAPNRTAQGEAEIPQRPKPEAKGLVAFSPDGEFYVSASPDGRLQYRRATDGVALRTIYHCNPRAVVFSANGQLLASAGGPGDGPTTIKVTRVADGELLFPAGTSKQSFAAGSKPLLSFSPDGLLLASSDGKAGLNLWQLPEGTLKQSVTASASIAALTWSKDGQTVVVVCADGSVQHFQVMLQSPVGK